MGAVQGASITCSVMHGHSTQPRRSRAAATYRCCWCCCSHASRGSWRPAWVGPREWRRPSSLPWSCAWRRACGCAQHRARAHPDVCGFLLPISCIQFDLCTQLLAVLTRIQPHHLYYTTAGLMLFGAQHNLCRMRMSAWAAFIIVLIVFNCAFTCVVAAKLSANQHKPCLCTLALPRLSCSIHVFTN